MTIPIARIGDRTEGICNHPDHDSPVSIGGIITTGLPTVSAGGLGVARMGDTVTTDCGHEGRIDSGNPSVLVGGLPVANLGSTVTGYYVATIVTASITVSA